MRYDLPPLRPSRLNLPVFSLLPVFGNEYVSPLSISLSRAVLKRLWCFSMFNKVPRYAMHRATRQRMVEQVLQVGQMGQRRDYDMLRRYDTRLFKDFVPTLLGGPRHARGPSFQESSSLLLLSYFCSFLPRRK